MIIKFLLSTLFVFVFLIGFIHVKEHKKLAIVVMLFSFFATLATWFDSTVSAIAHAVGVGRGADLVLYTALPICLLVVIMVFARLRRLESQLTALARGLAITGATGPVLAKPSGD